MTLYNPSDRFKSIGLSVEAGVTWMTSPVLPIESLASRQNSLLQLLATANENGVSPAPLIRAFAMEHRRRYRRLLRKFADRLERSGSLIQALQETPDVLSDEMVLAIQMNSESGATSQSMKQLVHSEKRYVDDVQEKWNLLLTYAVTILLILPVLILPTIVFVVPTFKKLFDEFEMPLPTVTKLFIAVLDWVAEYLFPMLPIALLGFLVYWLTPARHWIRRMARKWLLGIGTPRVRIALLRRLSDGCALGESVETLLPKLKTKHYAFPIRLRLGAICRRMERGVSVWNSLAKSRVIRRAQAESLAALSDRADQAWLLKQIAQAEQQKHRNQVFQWLSGLQPFAVLCIALAVMFFCVSMFMPLTNLISALARS